MYRLVLYILGIMSAVGILFSWLKLLPFNPPTMILSLAILSIFGMLSKIFLEKIFGSITNFESTLITILILFLILPPPENYYEMLVIAMAIIIANASKYLLAINNKHIFNPAAVAAVIIVYVFQYGATWWVGSAILLPITLLLGFLTVRKTRRIKMFLTFVLSGIISILFFGFISGADYRQLLLESFTSWPLIFFGAIMLTEPLTSPISSTVRWQYALLVGFLFGMPLRLGFFNMSPEIALLIGNLFSFYFSNRKKLFMILKRKVKLAPEIYEFVFDTNQNLNFFPGQYFEMTQKQNEIDNRGNRRFFTIASSPTEKQIRLGIKIPKNMSSFKKQLQNSPINSLFTADHLGGDFALPEKRQEKLVFIAGGIGITPFRSMIRYLIDIKEKRNIVLFYIGSSEADFVYKKIFEEAKTKINLKIIYVITQKQNLPNKWHGLTGYLTPAIIKNNVSDYKNRYYYLSGPRSMVTAYENVLSRLKIQQSKIVIDYFPGY